MSSLHSPSPPGSRPRDTLPDTPPDGRPGALPDDGWALLFPGTGAAGAPAVWALAGSGRAARRIVADVLDAVQEGLPRRWPSLRRVLLDDPASYRAAAATPGVPQLSDYATSVAVERVLRAGGVAPAFAVGQSFGEIAALVCAGAFSVTDGARLAVGAVRVLARHGHGGGMALLQAAPPSAETLIGRAHLARSLERASRERLAARVRAARRDGADAFTAWNDNLALAARTATACADRVLLEIAAEACASDPAVAPLLRLYALRWAERRAGALLNKGVAAAGLLDRVEELRRRVCDEVMPRAAEYAQALDLPAEITAPASFVLDA
ncbi:acyl-CoA dehydrogenase [Actinomadura sp. NPDC047616]|uniref:acyl-CoA dehydrogenase n=1 Tax=Actinomadura sp. NPDC047616 TaxID=3155914 RepID=UPI0033F36430